MYELNSYEHVQRVVEIRKRCQVECKNMDELNLRINVDTKYRDKCGLNPLDAIAFCMNNGMSFEEALIYANAGVR